MKAYGKLVTMLIAAWFTFALSTSALHLFKTQSSRLGAAIGLAALAPIVLFSLWFAVSDRFRHFALSLNPRTLTYLQFGRLLGVVFLVLMARGALPAIFAVPAGYGDIFIGATASFVAWKLAKPSHRSSFILWNVLGIADLVIAVGLGTTAGLISPHSIPMAAATVLPLSLIPTFFVPLFVILHVICIAQGKDWTTASNNTQTRRPVQGVATSALQS
jgi:hypothetical protein